MIPNCYYLTSTLHLENCFIQPGNAMHSAKWKNVQFSLLLWSVNLAGGLRQPKMLRIFMPTVLGRPYMLQQELEFYLCKCKM